MPHSDAVCVLSAQPYFVFMCITLVASGLPSQSSTLQTVLIANLFCAVPGFFFFLFASLKTRPSLPLCKFGHSLLSSVVAPLLNFFLSFLVFG